ncbi:MAG: helix-turn-helix transcriptional regulator [Oscillospiraceae bacterium]|nr:helix-turn-helix transcriptional regulator [Oscillospiraceae bacterium]
MKGRRNLSSKSNLFRNIDHKRRDKDMTLEEFSKAIGIDKKTFFNLEKKGDMPATLLIPISRVLDCSVDYLLWTDAD